MLDWREACARQIASGTFAEHWPCSDSFISFDLVSAFIKINMAYNYVVTAHKPTAVNACATGNNQ